MLQLTQEIKGTAFVYVVNERTSLNNQTPDYVSEAFKTFQTAETKEDFFKIGNQFYFFVRENKKLKKNREVFGC